MTPDKPAFVSVLVALSLTAPSAWAQNPVWPHAITDEADLSNPDNQPDDPSYYNEERNEAGEVTRVGGQWNLWSFVPQYWIDTGDPIRPEEIELGTGLHADRAWLLTPGRRDVLIAVLDSGAYWDNEDLRYKYYLNPGELDRDGARPCVPDGFSGDPLDVNGDGIFNVADYETHGGECGFDIDAEGNANGRIDPQDLIQSPRYADGIDDDENGYADDISGWDFFHNDNDAYDDTRYGHGNGEARGSSAQGNNGIGGLGVCPECTVLMVRAGDTFIAESNEFADSLVFAVDSGATVIQSALGAINHTTFAQQALEYAYQNNRVFIASAADELSFHHNFPGTNNHTVYVHAVAEDAENRSLATSFLNNVNCSNHGAQLVLSTPASNCSSGATEISAGHAGLITSYALDLDVDPPLSAEEVRGLMIMSVDDIDIPESQPDHPDYDGTKYPSAAGWDFVFGYGRNNARRSLELIRDGAIPPEVDIVSPQWFETVRPDDATTTVEVVGRIGARVDGLAPRYESYDWVLELAPGHEPEEDEFVEVAGGTTASLDGTLGTIDLAGLQATGVPDSPHHFGQTVRLRACVTGRGGFDSGGICGEYRKLFFVHDDPDLFEGFPLDVGGSIEGSATFYDLDGDDADELIIATSDGDLHAFNDDGTEVDGWPVFVALRRGHRDDLPNDHRGACAYRPAGDRGDCPTGGHVDYEVRETVLLGSPAVANLEGDEEGDVEVVIASHDGGLYAFNEDGSLVDGFPVRTVPAFSANTDPGNMWDNGFFTAPTLYDLDDDGDLEIIASAADQHVYVWHHDGRPMDGWPVYCRDLARDDDPDLTPSVGARIVAAPAVGDLDADGFPEVLVGTNEVYEEVHSRYYIIHWDGNEHERGPFEWLDPDLDAPGPVDNVALQGEVLPTVGRGIPVAGALADVDFDGYIEFAIEGIGGQPHMWRWDGEEVVEVSRMDNSTPSFGPRSNVTDTSSFVLINHGAFGYLDDSGDLAYVKGAAGFQFGLAFAAGFERLDFSHQLAGWNVRTGDPLEGFPRAMDDWQFFVAPTIVDLDDDNFAEVVSGSGGYLVHAFNYRGDEPEGWPKHTGGWVVSGPAVGDFDGDGNRDIAVGTRNGTLWVWRTEGSVDGIIEWNGFGHDNRNTFNYETGFPDRERPTPPGDPGAEVVEAAPDTGVPPDVGADIGVDAGQDGGGAADSGDTAEQATADDSGCCRVAPARERGAGGVLLAALCLLAAFVTRRRR